MKKLIVLMMVLAMVSMANAVMTLDISVNGDLDPTDSEYTVAPAATLELDIHSTDGYTGTEDAYWFMVANASLATITGGAPTVIAPTDTAWYGDDAGSYVPGADPGSWGFIGDIAGVPVGPDVYIDSILFTCVTEGDVAIKLWSSPDFIAYTLEDTVVIHQLIPEPMTIALLGVGGLFLRRRKRK